MLKSVVFVSIVAATPAVAQIPAPTQPAAGGAAQANPLDKKVCRTEEQIGTRLGSVKRCRTLREWRQMEDENKEAVAGMQRNTGIRPSN